MIQRIQTLYLLAVAAMMTTAIFTPLANFMAGVEEFKLFAFALKSAETSHSTIYMGIVIVLAAIVLAFLFWCRAEFVAQYGVPPHLRPTSTHFQ